MGGFATISQGPSGPTTSNPGAAPNGLSLDNQNNILASVGKAGTEGVLMTLLGLIAPQLPLSAITTAQNFFTKALNAGALNRQGRAFRVKGSFVYSTTTANVATLTIALKLGSVTLATITTAASNTTASTNLQGTFSFDVIVNATGKSGVLQTHGNVSVNLGTATTTSPTGYLDANVDPILTATIGTNPTAADTITVNGTLVTFIVNGGTPVGNQVALGTTTTATATALYTFLAASADANIVKSTWTNPSAGVVVGTAIAAGFIPSASTSVPAKITISNTLIDLTAAQTLAVTIAGGAAIPSATLNYATIELLG